MHSKGKGCWYYTTVVACPICGRQEMFRERRPPPKPKDTYELFEYVEAWDYCNAL